MVTLTINDQKIEVDEGITLLTAIEGIGIKVPTLCHHKALFPYGACRLCVVEVQVPGKAASLQASCSYPVIINGINVQTESDRIFRARKIVAELLLARCPDSEIMIQIAGEYGVKEPRIKTKNEDCFLCGLCVRMCEERMGRSAIGFTGKWKLLIAYLMRCAGRVEPVISYAPSVKKCKPTQATDFPYQYRIPLIQD
jgi:heterodisulfide reductase subunit A